MIRHLFRRKEPTKLAVGSDVPVPACQRCNRASFTVITEGAILQPSPLDGKTYFWHLVNKTPDMGDEQLIESFRIVFNKMKNLFFPLKLDSTSDIDKAQIFVHFAHEGDDILPVPFGSNSVLGYAFAPEGIYAGKMYLNDRWDWANMHDAKRQKMSLPIVLMHEALHLFNIGHSRVSNDIMYPTYNPDAVITTDTIDAVNHLYGKLKQKILDEDAQGRKMDKMINMLRSMFPNDEELLRLTETQILTFAHALQIPARREDLKADTARRVIRKLHNGVSR